MWFRFSLCTALLLSLVTGLFSQSQSAIKELRTLHISETSEEIVIDGQLNEAVWKSADASGPFNQRFPADTSLSESQTEVMLTYDRQFLYLAAICQDSIPGKIRRSNDEAGF